MAVFPGAYSPIHQSIRPLCPVIGNHTPRKRPAACRFPCPNRTPVTQIDASRCPNFGVTSDPNAPLHRSVNRDVGPPWLRFRSSPAQNLGICDQIRSPDDRQISPTPSIAGVPKPTIMLLERAMSSVLRLMPAVSSLSAQAMERTPARRINNCRTPVTQCHRR